MRVAIRSPRAFCLMGCILSALLISTQAQAGVFDWAKEFFGINAKAAKLCDQMLAREAGKDPEVLKVREKLEGQFPAMANYQDGEWLHVSLVARAHQNQGILELASSIERSIAPHVWSVDIPDIFMPTSPPRQEFSLKLSKRQELNALFNILADNPRITVVRVNNQGPVVVDPQIKIQAEALGAFREGAALPIWLRLYGERNQDPNELRNLSKELFGTMITKNVDVVFAVTSVTYEFEVTLKSTADRDLLARVLSERKDLKVLTEPPLTF